MKNFFADPEFDKQNIKYQILRVKNNFSPQNPDSS